MCSFSSLSPTFQQGQPGNLCREAGIVVMLALAPARVNKKMGLARSQFHNDVTANINRDVTANIHLLNTSDASRSRAPISGRSRVVHMLAISRFQVPQQDATFAAAAGEVVARFAESSGCRSARLVRNLDDPELWAITSEWDDVGSYRRAFNGTAAKMVFIPLLSRAIDEPSAYVDAAELGENVPRGTLS